MNEQQLKRKLSILTSTQVPKGYWQNYWPRLQMKLGRMDARVSEPRGSRFVSIRMWVPVLSVLIVGFIGYWVGKQYSSNSLMSSPDLRLASDSTESHAQKVFNEMLQLFPNRVNWISFVDGKVDFSISSVAYKDTQKLVPLIVAVSRPKEDFEARFMLRPGQEATIHAPWDSKTTVDLKLQLEASTQRIQVTCRLTGVEGTSSVEGGAKLQEGQGAVVGALRWGPRLSQIQLTRPAATQAKPEKSKNENPNGITL